MKLSIGELTTLIEHIERTPYRPLQPAVARIQERFEANKRKKLKKYVDKILRS